MGRLRTVSLILILGAWGGATSGADPDDAAGAASSATRKAPPAAPIKYLKAGAELFNDRKFDLAAKYLKAADMYRDQLRDDECKMLDLYLQELAKVQQGTPAAPPVRDAAVAPASAATSPVPTAPAVA
ncbi:MAG: hypothetical protein ACYC61_04750, partial [Isosphaeraceae bacterium]